MKIPLFTENLSKPDSPILTFEIHGVPMLNNTPAYSEQNLQKNGVQFRQVSMYF